MKAILARQRPYTGQGEGKFFSGNWTAGSFPSGHATLAWTLATVMAHEYPNWPMRLLMYGAATAVSTTRVTGGVHFPSDVFAGSVIGFGVGTTSRTKIAKTHGAPCAEQDQARRERGPERTLRFSSCYTTKYFAAGWCTTMADVLCSGSSRNPVVRWTPMVSSGWSSANSLV